MRKIIFVFLFLIVISAASSSAADEIQDKLTLTYSIDKQLCNQVFKLYTEFQSCPLKDGLCFWFKWTDGPRITKITFDELACNEYGYTLIYYSRDKLVDRGYSIVYLMNFQGDNSPRLQETWKVDAMKLSAVLELPPGPIPYEKWIGLNPKHDKNTNAAEFSELLKSGEKLSDQWSPVFEIDGDVYLIQRECSGLWVFGGYYKCNKIIKLTVKKIHSEKKAEPCCQFARPKKKAIKK
jgi:hypothetical protein